MTRLVDAVCSIPWAIREESLQAILEIASREGDLSPEAVSALLGKPLENTHTVTVRNGVATIPIEGPIVRYASFFTAISGGTSIEMIAQDLVASLASDEIKAIILNIDSPGGEVNGVAELSDLIYEARGSKPIVAYVSNQGCSAAYWIASAADKIITSPTSMLGSIGVVATFGKPTPEEKARSIEFVSSQSPKKRPNLDTKEGRGQIQTMVDAIADVFVNRVARNRSVTVDTVVEEFGEGGIFIGQMAVDAGLADEVGSYERTVASLQGKPRQDETKGEAKAMGDRWNQFMSFLREEDGTQASADPVVVPTPAQLPIQVPPAPAATSANEQVVALQQEVQRLRLTTWQAQAEEWASKHVLSQRAFPAEKPHMLAAYVQAAMDDLTMGDISGSGKTRVSMLAALYDNRPANQLTLESLTPSFKELVLQREKAPEATGDDKPLDQAGLEEHLARTPLGAAVLSDMRSNGTALVKP